MFVLPTRTSLSPLKEYQRCRISNIAVTGTLGYFNDTHSLDVSRGVSGPPGHSSALREAARMLHATHGVPWVVHSKHGDSLLLSTLCLAGTRLFCPASIAPSYDSVDCDEQSLHLNRNGLVCPHPYIQIFHGALLRVARSALASLTALL